MGVVPVRWCRAVLRRWLFSYIVLAVLLGLLLGALVIGLDSFNSLDSALFVGTVTTTTEPSHVALSPDRVREALENRKTNKNNVGPNPAELRMKWLKDKIDRMTRKVNGTSNNAVMASSEDVLPNENVQIFYYAWYETPEVDGKWKHWNHNYIPNWKKDGDPKEYPMGKHSPPADIGANFYPQLGCYSSRNTTVIDIHMRQIRLAGIGVLVVSWYPPGLSDMPQESQSPDHLFRNLLDAANAHGLKIAPHIEPYQDRNPINFLTHLKYFQKEYGGHPALYKMQRGSRHLPVLYVYDSYRTPAAAWRELLGAKGNLSIRGTSHDAVFLGLLVDMEHKHEIKRAHFDGFYTYFASNGFSYGSTWKNWKQLSKFATENKLIFVPSIGPGYIDTRVRPWNAANTRHRRRGTYYGVGWRSAIAARAPIVSITSFNEWHEGTQIEPAVPAAMPGFVYLDYEPEGAMFYLNLTRWWVREFTNAN